MSDTNSRRRHTVTVIRWLWGGLLWLAGASSAAAEPLEKYEFLQIRMGVSVAIQVYAEGPEAANQAADAAYARFKQLDRTLSDYDPDSELMRLCAESGPGRPIAVSEDLANVLGRSQSLAARTEGAFDVTVGPIVNLWRIARRRKSPPDPNRLQSALAKVGYCNLQLDCERRTVELLQRDMRLDLGGIAVGYAVDQAMEVFHEHGLKRVLIDASGDIAVGDPPPGRDRWRIEVEPLLDGKRPRRVLALRNCAVTTSGDTSKYVEFGGVRYSHIVDPKTGLGLTRRTSATIIAPDCTTADSLATTVNVLGPDRGLELIGEIDGAEARIEYVSGTGQAAEVESAGFASLLMRLAD